MPDIGEELVFYTNPQSRGQTARWMLEEVGAPYRTEILDYGTTMKAPEYLAINPMGKVPAITHRGVVITEVAAICAYLADAFPEAGLAPPPGDPARGPYHRWIHFASGPLEAAATNAAMGFVTPTEREACMGYGRLDLVLDALEGALKDTVHLAGDRFSAADLHMASKLGFLMQFELVEKRPAFEAYVAHHFERPAFKRAQEIDLGGAPK